MVRILLIHNTDMLASDYRKKLLAKYPILGDYPEIWKVDIIKLGKKMTKIQRGRKYDSLYYDQPTCTMKEIVPYITQMGHPALVAVDLDKIASGGPKKKHTTFIKSTVKTLKEK